MATITDVETIARTYLRDFPKFFQVSFPVVGRTYELGHINIDTSTIWVAKYSGSGSASTLAPSEYTIDPRNGVVRLSNTLSSSTTLLVEGYYYEWVTPDDLSFYAHRAVEKHTSNLRVTLEEMSGIVIDTIGIATIVESLWALMTEFSRDIDVMTSESIHIPASQRFRMVQSLLSQWEGEYRRHATALNIGVDRLEVFELRRKSRTTNYLVPIYRNRELGDYTPPERLWPNIDYGVIEKEIEKEELRTDVLIDGAIPTGSFSNIAYY
jgi:hypothetical protein